jgi:phosphoenolpyruvate carboxykinase (GTP)
MATALAEQVAGNPEVKAFIDDAVQLMQPGRVEWVSGTAEEQDLRCKQLVADGVFVPLNQKEYPNSYWCVSHPSDVARVEDRTFICSRSRDDSGPTNIWAEPTEMYNRLRVLMKGCMKGRTMYVVPYLMGPDGSPYSRVGFELTDSPYVVANMYIMARIGDVALRNLKSGSQKFVKGLHSVGTLNPEYRFICHFPEDATIISFNSNYGGNALQGKKCFALRIASALGRREGWMAEHMLILGVTNPKGQKSYVCAAFPSACGKTNFAMMVPPPSYQKAGWKIETLGDDIAWLNPGPDGRLYAINPEAGFFGVAPGTSAKTNPNALAALHSNTIFTNTALDLDTMNPWWEGLSAPPQRAKDWLNHDWTPASGTKAAHPNSRFTAPANQCPCISPEWQAPHGVPISAIIFGGRRATTAPLVYEARNWNHGTYVGVTMASETTAAAAGKTGELRRDPMAMRPFIGYHAGDYFQHWLEMGRRGGTKMPKIFHVNWFRTDEQGKFIWPGFGDNMRVLEWILGRVQGDLSAKETPIGFLPEPGSLNREGLELSDQALGTLLSVDPTAWKAELESQREFLREIGDRLPKALWTENEELERRLGL